MNFWNIQKLKNDLANQTINQRDFFLYYLLTGIIFAFLVSPYESNSFFYYQAEIYKWIDWGFTNIFYFLMIFLCYAANDGKNGKNFLERIVSLEIILAIRYFVFFFIPYEIVHSLFFDGGIYSDLSNLIGTTSFSLILLIRIFSCMKDIQTVEN